MKKKTKIIFISVLVFIITLNILAGFHAWKFTHFTSEMAVERDFKDLDFWDKAITLFTGNPMPRPENYALPTIDHDTLWIQSNMRLECWDLQHPSGKGTIAVFHGYGRQKSFMLPKAEYLYQQGYSIFLTDFMGSGGSEGMQTTIGYKEAEEVKDVYEFLKKRGDQKIILFGTSLGAVAIMKAVSDYQIDPDEIILECPFGSFYETVEARFKLLNAPAFPLAYILMFWGSVENGIWAFNHNPVEYAKNIHCPVLLVHGQNDEKVSRREIMQIYHNLQGKKYLGFLSQSGHDDYFVQSEREWKNLIRNYLNLKN